MTESTRSAETGSSRMPADTNLYRSGNGSDMNGVSNSGFDGYSLQQDNTSAETAYNTSQDSFDSQEYNNIIQSQRKTTDFLQSRNLSDQSYFTDSQGMNLQTQKLNEYNPFNLSVDTNSHKNVSYDFQRNDGWLENQHEFNPSKFVQNNIEASRQDMKVTPKPQWTQDPYAYSQDPHLPTPRQYGNPSVGQNNQQARQKPVSAVEQLASKQMSYQEHLLQQQLMNAQNKSTHPISLTKPVDERYAEYLSHFQQSAALTSERDSDRYGQIRRPEQEYVDDPDLSTVFRIHQKQQETIRENRMMHGHGSAHGGQQHHPAGFSQTLRYAPQPQMQQQQQMLYGGYPHQLRLGQPGGRGDYSSPAGMYGMPGGRGGGGGGGYNQQNAYRPQQHGMPYLQGPDRYSQVNSAAFSSNNAVNREVVYLVQMKLLCRYHMADVNALPLGEVLSVGDFVIIDADKGEDIGVVTEVLGMLDFMAKQQQSKMGGAGQLDHDDSAVGRILRVASKYERQQLPGKFHDEQIVVETCRTVARNTYAMNINIIEAEYQFDRNKLIIYYDAPVRIDFRELVRDNNY